jgi:hypothetical protein
VNAWTVLIGTLAVDRKPIPVRKRKRESRAMTDLSRKEICALANKAMCEKRKDRRAASKHEVYTETLRPSSAQEISDRTDKPKTYVRELLLELVAEGKLKREKCAMQTYYYERI